MVQAAGRLAKQLQRLQEDKDAALAAIATDPAAETDAAAAEVTAVEATEEAAAVTPGQAEEAFFNAPRRTTRNSSLMGVRPPGFEGPPLVRVLFADGYGCLDRTNGVCSRGCRLFWFKDGTHFKTVSFACLMVPRVGAAPPTLPDLRFYSVAEGEAQLQTFSGVLRRGNTVWVEFNEQIDRWHNTDVT